MTPVSFPEHNVVYAKDQPQYLALPAHIERNPEGLVTFCWKLSWRERLRVLLTGLIWHQVLTFKKPLQPQLLSVEKPELHDF
jgi:hypothetical protein